jgi:hypothetical protein
LTPTAWSRRCHVSCGDEPARRLLLLLAPRCHDPRGQTLTLLTLLRMAPRCHDPRGQTLTVTVGGGLSSAPPPSLPPVGLSAGTNLDRYDVHQQIPIQTGQLMPAYPSADTHPNRPVDASVSMQPMQPPVTAKPEAIQLSLLQRERVLSWVGAPGPHRKTFKSPVSALLTETGRNRQKGRLAFLALGARLGASLHWSDLPAIQGRL